MKSHGSPFSVLWLRLSVEQYDLNQYLAPVLALSFTRRLTLDNLFHFCMNQFSLLKIWLLIIPLFFFFFGLFW